MVMAVNSPDTKVKDAISPTLASQKRYKPPAQLSEQSTEYPVLKQLIFLFFIIVI
jgi:hypothetical protein